MAKDGLGELLAGAVRDKTVLLVPTAMETQLRLPAFEQAAWLPIQHVLLTQNAHNSHRSGGCSCHGIFRRSTWASFFLTGFTVLDKLHALLVAADTNYNADPIERHIVVAAVGRKHISISLAQLLQVLSLIEARPLRCML